MLQYFDFMVSITTTYVQGYHIATPVNVTIAEEEFSYCTANVTSCRVTITELYDAALKRNVAVGKAAIMCLENTFHIVYCIQLELLCIKTTKYCSILLFQLIWKWNQ